MALYIGDKKVSLTLNKGNILLFPYEITSDGFFRLPQTSFEWKMDDEVKILNFTNLFKQRFKNNKNITKVDFNNVIILLGQYIFNEAFYGATNITSLNVNKIENLGDYTMDSCFYNCTGLTSVDFASLTTIGEGGFKSGFRGCTNLVSAKLNKLKTVTRSSSMNSLFYGCTKLKNIEFNSLTTVSGSAALLSAFRACTSLETIVFPELSTISGNSCLKEAFYGCTSLKSINFPALVSLGTATTQFNNMLYGVTGCTVHFPSNMQDTLSSWASVTAGFGGTDTVILFDLPSTI